MHTCWLAGAVTHAPASSPAGTASGATADRPNGATSSRLAMASSLAGATSPPPTFPSPAPAPFPATRSGISCTTSRHCGAHLLSGSGGRGSAERRDDLPSRDNLQVKAWCPATVGVPGAITTGNLSHRHQPYPDESLDIGGGSASASCGPGYLGHFQSTGWAEPVGLRCTRRALLRPWALQH